MSAKVAILINAFWNHKGQGATGGDQRVLQIFKRIARYFHAVSVVTSPYGKEWMSRANQTNFKYCLSAHWFESLPVFVVYLLRTISCLPQFLKQDFDYLYASSDFFPDVIPAYLYRLTHPQAKWIQCVFHIYPHWKTRPGNKVINYALSLLQKFSLLLIRRADLIININHQVQTELIALGFEAAKIQVNPTGLDLTLPEQISSTEFFEASFLARLNPSKGIFDLVPIWQKVVAKLPRARLVVIGGGNIENTSKLQKMIVSAGLTENIILKGFLETSQAVALLRNSKLFVFPSHEEGFGMAIAEAMALGLPVVCWNLAVYEEVFEHIPQRATENDLDQFAERIYSLLLDESRRKALSQEGIHFIKKYAWESIAERELGLITSL